VDYKLLDSGDFYRLEKVGDFIFHRPSPAAVWPSSDLAEYKSVDAKYNRYENGKGDWVRNKKVPDSFLLKMKNLGLGSEFNYNFTVEMQLTSFGHLGLFFEQLVNWRRLLKHVSEGEKVLNLFAYTGMSSIVCAAKDAEVTHLDASKTSVAWAKNNAELSKLADKKIRWLVEDVRKFVEREVRRQNTYDWIILDPPSFGRGTNNESWVIEKDLVPLLKNLNLLKSKNFKGILLSSHSPGYTGVSLDNLLVYSGFSNEFKISEDMIIDHKKYPLPSGFGVWRSSINLD
jgi:23S rRNA (cytosine1962-C5)-methyltransferase